MSYSGDAAEQVVRLSLETGEVAVKLAGEGAKQLAILLYAILREQKKTKGKTRLTNMLRSGKELKVFAVKDSDLQLFCREAKKYGVLYCVLKDRDATDGITDIMVRAEDASKINRIFERFNLATVDMAEIRSEIERSRQEQQAEVPEAPAAAEPMTEQEVDELLDAMLSPPRSAPPPNPNRTWTSFWHRCWALPPPGRRARPKTPPKAGSRNPVSPSLPQSPKSQPHRVLLIRRSVPVPPSVRSWTRLKRSREKRRQKVRSSPNPARGRSTRPRESINPNG